MSDTPQQLGKYRIVSELGRGGFATVYRAADSALGREVALKVLDPLLMRDATFVTRFQREARAAAGLEHPQIVPIYDVGEADGRLFIAMRLVRGGSLGQRLRAHGPLPWDDVLLLMRQAGAALAYAHSQGVIHRDLKPDNLLLDEVSGAQVSDFGFARLIGNSTLTLTASGGILGTPAYIAPELWEGQEATPASDIYALACVLYELLTGEALFTGPTPISVMRAHDQGPRFPEQWPVDIPLEVVAILRKGTDRNPNARYQSVAEFIDGLQGIAATARAERIAAEVARMLQQHRDAMEKGQFAAALESTGRALALHPDHTAAQTARATAQELHDRQASLLEQVEVERKSLSEKQSKLEDEANSVNEKSRAQRALLDDIDADITATQQQLASLRAHLDLLEDKHKTARAELVKLEEQPGKVVECRQGLATKLQVLDRVRALVCEGKLDTGERLLNHGAPPPGTNPSGLSISPEPAQPLRLLRVFGLAGEPLSSIAFSPDGAVLAAGSRYGRATLWAWRDGRHLDTVSANTFVNAIAFTPDGETLAMGCADNRIHLWNLEERRVIDKLTQHQAAVTALDTNAGRGWLASASADGTIAWWSLEGWQVVDTLVLPQRAPEPVQAVRFAPDGAWLAITTQTQAVLHYNSDTRTWSNDMTASSWPAAMALSAEGRCLAVSTNRHTVEAWKMPEQQPAFTLRGFSSIVWSLTFAQADRLLITGEDKGRMKVWCPALDMPAQTIEIDGGTVRGLAVSPDGAILASAHADGLMRTWEIADV